MVRVVERISDGLRSELWRRLPQSHKEDVMARTLNFKCWPFITMLTDLSQLVSFKVLGLGLRLEKEREIDI